MGSPSVSLIRPFIWLRRIQFSVIRYSFLRKSSSSTEPVTYANIRFQFNPQNESGISQPITS